MRFCSRSSASAHQVPPLRNWNEARGSALSANQFLLTESTYCRERASGCADRYIAEELRRLAEQFERTAAAMESAARDKISQNAGSGF